MKPDTSTAMQHLIDEVRATLPFGASEAQLCADACQGCSLKLLEFLETELEDWERKLQQEAKPNFGDIQRMSKISTKVYMVLKKNGLIEESPR